jgi:hypothetical protein
MKHLLMALVSLTLLATACGDDDGDDTADALSAVCDANASVVENLDALEALTPAVNTTDEYRDALDSVQSSVDDLRAARADLVEQDVSNVESAFDQLRADLEGLGDVALADAGDEITSAIESGSEALADFYDVAFANSSCAE